MKSSATAIAQASWCVIFGVCFACQSPPPTAAEPLVAIAAPSPVSIELPPPTGTTATLVVMRDGQDGYEKVPTQVTGAADELVPLGERRSFPFAASATELTRIMIDGRAYLIAIEPGAELLLSDNPCNGWELSTASWDANLLDPPRVACTADARNCPDGYVPSPLPGLADDPLCTAEEDRCVQPADFILIAPMKVSGQPMDVGGYFEAGPTVCDWVELETGNDHVRLYPNAGGRWTLAVEDARIEGHAAPVETSDDPLVGTAFELRCIQVRLGLEEYERARPTVLSKYGFDAKSYAAREPELASTPYLMVSLQRRMDECTQTMAESLVR